MGFSIHKKMPYNGQMILETFKVFTKVMHRGFHLFPSQKF